MSQKIVRPFIVKVSVLCYFPLCAMLDIKKSTLNSEESRHIQ